MMFLKSGRSDMIDDPPRENLVTYWLHLAHTAISMMCLSGFLTSGWSMSRKHGCLLLMIQNDLQKVNQMMGSSCIPCQARPSGGICFAPFARPALVAAVRELKRLRSSSCG